MNSSEKDTSLLDKKDQLRAIRCAMRVWPAFWSGGKTLDLDIGETEALMVYPWMTLLGGAAESSLKETKHQFFRARNKLRKNRNGLAARVRAAAADAADAAHAAATAAAPAIDAAHAASVNAYAAGHADADAIRVAFENDLNMASKQELFNCPLWQVERSGVFNQHWDLVVGKWADRMEKAGLGVWVERYRQACERGFTEEEARQWFLGEESKSSFVSAMPFGGDEVAFAEFIYHYADEFELARKTSASDSRPSFENLVSLFPDGIPGEGELRREVERGLSVAPPDSLWLSWFTKTQFLKTRSLYEEAWEEVFASSSHSKAS